MRLYLSIITCEGLIATMRERVQFTPNTKRYRSPKPSSKAQKSAALTFEPPLWDYCGSLHVHSTYSDGAEPISGVAAAANEAGLDFVLMCDHSNLDAITDRQTGWSGSTLVIVGTEVTTDTGHLLAVDVEPDYLPSPHEAVAAQKHILDKGAIGFIALPCDLKDSWRDFSKHVDGIGLEVFNLSAIARTKINVLGFISIWRRYHSKHRMRAFHLVSARPDEELRLWDRMMRGENGQARKVVGIACVDAHGVMKFMGKTYYFPTYKEVFQTLRTHVLLPTPLRASDDAGADAQNVHNAIRRGHCYMAYDNFADSQGFRFHALSSDGSAAATIMGDAANISSGQGTFDLQAVTPKKKSFMRLLKNGEIVSSGPGNNLRYRCKGPGAYRVEAYLYKFRIGPLYFGVKPWIFSNPIYLAHSSN